MFNNFLCFFFLFRKFQMKFKYNIQNSDDLQMDWFVYLCCILNTILGMNKLRDRNRMKPLQILLKAIKWNFNNYFCRCMGVCGDVHEIKVSLRSNEDFFRNYIISTMWCSSIISCIFIWNFNFIFERKICTISYSNHFVFITCDGNSLRSLYIDVMPN